MAVTVDAQATWFLKITQLSRITLPQGLAVAAMIGNPFMTHIVFEGQLTLIATAAILGCWHLVGKQRPVLAALCLTLATIKPQVALLLIAWLIINRHLAVVVMGGALAGILLLPALISIGPIDAFVHWYWSMEAYQVLSANMPGSAHVVGLESLAVALGINGLGPFIKLGAFFGLVLMYRVRHLLNEMLAVQLLLVLALTLIYGHDTAYSALAILLGAFFYFDFATKEWYKIATTLGLMLVLFFPQRFLREFNLPALEHTRALVIPVVFYFVFCWQKQRINAST